MNILFNKMEQILVLLELKCKHINIFQYVIKNVILFLRQCINITEYIHHQLPDFPSQLDVFNTTTTLTRGTNT